MGNLYVCNVCGLQSWFEAVKTRAPTKSCAALEASHTPIVRSLLSSHRHANSSQSNHPWDVVGQKACFIGAWKMSWHLWPAVCLCLWSNQWVNCDRYCSLDSCVLEYNRITDYKGVSSYRVSTLREHRPLVADMSTAGMQFQIFRFVLGILSVVMDNCKKK